jgi:hypothetical protein
MPNFRNLKLEDFFVNNDLTKNFTNSLKDVESQFTTLENKSLSIFANLGTSFSNFNAGFSVLKSNLKDVYLNLQNISNTSLTATSSISKLQSGIDDGPKKNSLDSTFEKNYSIETTKDYQTIIRKFKEPEKPYMGSNENLALWNYSKSIPIIGEMPKWMDNFAKIHDYFNPDKKILPDDPYDPFKNNNVAKGLMMGLGSVPIIGSPIASTISYWGHKDQKFMIEDYNNRIYPSTYNGILGDKFGPTTDFLKPYKELFSMKFDFGSSIFSPFKSVKADDIIKLFPPFQLPDATSVNKNNKQINTDDEDITYPSEDPKDYKKYNWQKHYFYIDKKKKENETKEEVPFSIDYSKPIEFKPQFPPSAIDNVRTVTPPVQFKNDLQGAGSFNIQPLSLQVDKSKELFSITKDVYNLQTSLQKPAQNLLDIQKSKTDSVKSELSISKQETNFSSEKKLQKGPDPFQVFKGAFGEVQKISGGITNIMSTLKISTDSFVGKLISGFNTAVTLFQSVLQIAQGVGGLGSLFGTLFKGAIGFATGGPAGAAVALGASAASGGGASHAIGGLIHGPSGISLNTLSKSPLSGVSNPRYVPARAEKQPINVIVQGTMSGQKFFSNEYPVYQNNLSSKRY